MIITGLREIRTYLKEKHSKEEVKNIEVHYVKPFPPNLYLSIFKLVENKREFFSLDQLKKEHNLSYNTGILLKINHETN